MFDLIVAHGTAVLPSGVEPADIGVAQGRIVKGSADERHAPHLLLRREPTALDH